MAELNPPGPRAWAWLWILASVTLVGSLAAACMMPFAALGAIAAATLPGRKAFQAVLAAWVFNQAVGFVWLGFPHTAEAAAQGVTLALASLSALLVARAAGAGIKARRRATVLSRAEPSGRGQCTPNLTVTSEPPTPPSNFGTRCMWRCGNLSE